MGEIYILSYIAELVPGHFFSTYWIYISLCVLGVILMYFNLSKILCSISKKVFIGECKSFEKILKRPAFLFSLSIFIKFFIDAINLKILNYIYIENSVTLLVIFSSAWLVFSFVRVGKLIFFSRLEVRNDDLGEVQKIKTQIEIVEKIVLAIIIFVALASAVMNFESVRRIGISLFASAGITGIIIGFAAQKLIAALVSGIQIAITQPIKIDDAVVVEGEWGNVEEVNLTNVVIKTWDYRRLVLPTTYFMEKPFQNWTKGTMEILGAVFLHVDYTVPIEKVREEFFRLINLNDKWDGKTANIHITNTNERTVEIRGIMSSKDPADSWDLKVYVRENLIEYIRSNFPESLPRTRVQMENSKNE